MPLSDGYGVVIGTKKQFYRDDPDDFGRYYHGNLIVGAPSLNGSLQDFRCAIDVDPKNTPDGVMWQVMQLKPSNFANIQALSDGWHNLASNPSSGAVDYQRGRLLRDPFTFITPVFTTGWKKYLGPIFVYFPDWIVPPWWLYERPWKSGTGQEALTDLESVVQNGERCFVFGEPFTRGNGVHNIHQNQGDPRGSNFARENGVWQDGVTIIQKTDGSLWAFINKFKTQVDITDGNGLAL